jgi:ribosomal protein L3 glutamine methyltransferase
MASLIKLSKNKLTIKSAIEMLNNALLNSDVFFGHGTDNAWDEAVWMVLFVLKYPVDQPINNADTELKLDDIKALEVIVNKRINDNIPLAYLINSAWFCGLEFYVDERVIVPRSPIAECIFDAFEAWVNSDEITDVLDLCTGSGCIALATAHYMPHVNVDASDFSQAALEVAHINRKKLGLEDRVHFIYSDVFKDIPFKQYDVIVSNPPYVDEGDFKSMPKEFSHEPEMALTSGSDGLFVTHTILENAKKYLKPNGILIIEVGNSQRHLLEKSPLPFSWFEVENGGGGVFLLRAEQL